MREALNSILVSAPFRRSHQLQELLRYIVKHSNAHEDNLLRERVIGSVVFGRTPDYEPGEDPVVRLRAADLRRRLAQFYQGLAPDQSPSILIEIPPGSYRATFKCRFETQELASSIGSSVHDVEQLASDASDFTGLIPDPEEPGPALPLGFSAHSFGHLEVRRISKVRVILFAAVTCVALSIAALLAAELGHNRAYKDFWSPWTGDPKPTIISVGSNAVYTLSDQLLDPYARAHGLEAQGGDFYIQFQPDSVVYGRDLKPAYQSFIALGDLAATSTIVARLATQPHSFQERFPNDISFAELRTNPTVLIGGFNNSMTIELTRGLPLIFSARNTIQDTSSGHTWGLQTSGDAHNTEDYAIVTRLVNRGGDAPILTVAGIGTYGTVAAANYVCNPNAIAELARRLPRGWQHRNIQVLLHIHVVDFKPGAVEEVERHVW